MPNTPKTQPAQPTTGKLNGQSTQLIAAIVSILGGTGAFYGNKALQDPVEQTVTLSDKDREKLNQASNLVGQLTTRLDALETRLDDHKLNVATNVSEIKGDVRAIRTEQSKLTSLLTTIAANIPK